MSTLQRWLRDGKRAATFSHDAGGTTIRLHDLDCNRSLSICLADVELDYARFDLMEATVCNMISAMLPPPDPAIPFDGEALTEDEARAFRDALNRPPPVVPDCASAVNRETRSRR